MKFAKKLSFTIFKKNNYSINSYLYFKNFTIQFKKNEKLGAIIFFKLIVFSTNVSQYKTVKGEKNEKSACR